MDVVEVLLALVLVWLTLLLVVMTYLVIKVFTYIKVFGRMTKRIVTGFTLSFGFGKK